MGEKKERERTLPAHTQERSCEDIARRQSSPSQEERSHAGPKWPPPWPWTSQLLELWEVHVCCLSCPVDGIQWCQPELKQAVHVGACCVASTLFWPLFFWQGETQGRFLKLDKSNFDTHGGLVSVAFSDTVSWVYKRPRRKWDPSSHWSEELPNPAHHLTLTVVGELLCRPLARWLESEEFCETLPVTLVWPQLSAISQWRIFFNFESSRVSQPIWA